MDPETLDPPRLPAALRAAAWALVVVAVLLPVVLLGVHQRVFAGALDARYFSSYGLDAQGNETITVSPDVDFWDRWSILGYTAPPDRTLLAATAVCVALAGLHLSTGAHRPLSRACRWAGAGAAALSALAAAGFFVVDVVAAQLPEGSGAYFPSSSSFLDVAPLLSAMLTVIVFAAVAGAVLLGPVLPRPARAAGDAEEPVGEPGAGAVLEPVGERAVDPAPDPAGPAPVTPPAEAVPSFPRPSAEEYARYRRPPA